MPAQRARSAVAPDHRSAHPNLPGVPWWGAVLIAATLTAIGFAFDAGSGNKELSAVFAGSYVVGCILAVLAVRQSGIFTAVIQPPLILFVSVPMAYYLFTSGQSSDLKDTLINCGYPLIERFPLMFFTSAVVLLIGMARWYYGMSARRAAPETSATESTGGGLASKLSALLSRQPDDEDEEEPAPPRRRRTQERPSRSTRTTGAAASRNGRSSSRSATSRSRHARPPETEIIEPVADRPRRTRSGRQDLPPAPPGERGRPRTSSTSRRAMPPSDRRPELRPERPERRRRYDDYEPLEPHGSSGNGTHHPVSRVRYRGSDDGADDYGDYRPRRRTPRDRNVDAWEYDV